MAESESNPGRSPSLVEELPLVVKIGELHRLVFPRRALPLRGLAVLLPKESGPELWRQPGTEASSEASVQEPEADPNA